MSFLFPLFLTAGLAIAIPIIIHLFNFRKYKTVYFPDTRLLESVQTTSQKSARIRNWLLLLSRILFLIALILAFAQPYFPGSASRQQGLQLLYIDNSQSMGIIPAQEQQALLQKAIAAARETVMQLGPTQDYILFSNDFPYASRPQTQKEILQKLEQIRISARTVSLQQLVLGMNNALSDNNAAAGYAYLFSDMQRSTLLRDALGTQADARLNIYCRPIRNNTVQNLYFDTAYFVQPVIDTRQENPLVLRIARSGKANKNSDPVSVQVLVNNQVRAAKSLQLGSDTSVTDTLSLMISTPGWHEIALVLKDETVNYDDTFRITAKTNATLSVLNLSDSRGNPYLTAALSPANGFVTRQASLSPGNIAGGQEVNLVVMQQVATLSPEMAGAIRKGMDNGLSFLLIPQGIQDLQYFNQSLSLIAPIRFSALDTTPTRIGSIQSGHPLLKDVIAQMPADVQLPAVLQHYPIQADLNAGQQRIMTLQNGHPFLSQYDIGQGKLYLIASPLNEQSGNFVWSNLFLPILYKMCAQSGAQSIYALNANSHAPVFVPLHSHNRSVFTIKGADGWEAIPPQTPYGNGTQIYAGNVISQTGFYTLSNDTPEDSTLLAVNNDLLESQLNPVQETEIKTALKPAKVHWDTDGTTVAARSAGQDRSLWKWCIALALIALCIETYLLISKRLQHSK